MDTDRLDLIVPSLALDVRPEVGTEVPGEVDAVAVLLTTDTQPPAELGLDLAALARAGFTPTPGSTSTPRPCRPSSSCTAGPCSRSSRGPSPSTRPPPGGSPGPSCTARSRRPHPAPEDEPVNDTSTVTPEDLVHLRHCVELAREGLEAGDEPFGSVLVDGHGVVRFADRNRVAGGDDTRHPELEIARWAAAHLTPDERRDAVVYTSGEHCPMCSAAHAWVGLGTIVYAASTAQLTGWLQEWGVAPGPVAPLPVGAVAPGVAVRGPAGELADEVRGLHARLHGVAAG